ncbi:MAG: tetratricopeptide repeat protein [Desulfosporosinus sp.]|nr:tetratricopeptide repeat protein [Desulfosporosinus sp.]
MQGVQFDSEVLYVQKLYYFLFLATLSTLTCAIAVWCFSLKIGLLVLGGGLVISYIAMLKKKNFTPPEKKVTAQRMAHAISQDTSPLSIARFACQLYYYFHKPTQAISLLEKFLPSYDPILCMTLGDILLKEGKAKRALYVLRDNPHAFNDPLLLTTQGQALKQIEKIPEAVIMFERSLHLAKKNGFPHSGAHWLTQKLLTLSYTASIHHTLADCYVILGNPPHAKRHYRAGNRLLFDLSLWRCQPAPIRFAKKYSKSL